MINPPGPMETIIIVSVILLLFGGKKIPELAKGLGKGIREFKDGMKEMNNDTSPELNEKNGQEQNNEKKTSD